MEKRKRPNYNQIYFDLIKIKFPEMLEQYRSLLEKKTLSVLDIIKLNDAIFGNPNLGGQNQNQKYKAYDKHAIFEILTYQKKNGLNNSQVARHFRLSNHTVAAWKKKFLV